LKVSLGAGPVYAPRLLTALGTDRSRWDSSADLLSHSGIAPVTEKSGNSCWVHRRLACSNFIRQTFHEFAAQSIRWSRWARAYYDQMRARGLRHPAAVRALAFKWIRIIYRCWKGHQLYDEQTYLKALREKRSPLADKLDGQTNSDVQAAHDEVLEKFCAALNETQTVFPGTDLTLIFKIGSS